ncbi:MAG: PepSY-associated TM helix domain-containing protein [Cognaticolwellia sp.]
MQKLNFKKIIVKKMFDAHSAIGLAVGALMYIICLTGSLAVFYPEFERWEQPNIAEYQNFPASSVRQAYQQYADTVKVPEKSVYVVLPTKEVPRAHLSDGEQEWWLNQNGTFSAAINKPWTEMLQDLHIYLHLPKTLGIVIVSFLGVLLAHLIISGVLTHSRIFKDAFTLNWGGTGQKQQIDLHNRLSVWGLPFHAMIAITGAFFGLVSILILIAAAAFYDNDRAALIADIYGEEPMITNAPTLNVERSLANIAIADKQATPIYLVVQNMGSEKQFIEIAATLPERLIYSELYQFHADGSYIGQQGMANGPIGRQIVYSVYRLHFGHFGNIAVKFIYLILGLALTYISVSGINMWLNKRGRVDNINYLWCGFVYGTPLALSTALMTTVFINASPYWSFWLVLASCLIAAWLVKSVTKMRYFLLMATSATLIATIIGYSFIYGKYTLIPAIITINLCLLMYVILMVLHSRQLKIRENATVS